MNYLFFDIECSDGRHMCSFGYVLCDCRFNVLKQEDILINPEAPFRLARYGGEPQIQLGYPKERFYSSPNFVARYEKIKRILEAKNQLVIGHSILNDVNFLQLACERYDKPHFEYSFFDEQQIYKTINEGKAVSTALEKIAETYGVEPESLHRSDDDSKTTMEIVRHMCEDFDMSPEQLANAYPLSKGKVENGIVKRFVLDPYKWFCSAVFDINADKKNEKQVNGKGDTNAEQAGQAQQIIKKDKRFDGKKFCFATKLERTIPLKMYTVAQKISALGGEYTDNPAECDVFVKHQTSKCYRYVYATSHKGIRIVPFETLLDELGLKYEDLEPYEFKGDYVGKKPKPIETGVSHVESTPSSIGDHLRAQKGKKGKPSKQAKPEQNNDAQAVKKAQPKPQNPQQKGQGVNSTNRQSAKRNEYFKKRRLAMKAKQQAEKASSAN